MGLFLAFGKRRRVFGAATAIILMAGLAIGIAPITLKNYRLYNDFVPIAAHGGLQLYLGVNPQKEGGFRPSAGLGTGMKEMIDNSIVIAERDKGRTLKPSEVSAYWSARAFDNIRSSPLGFLALMLRRTAYFLNRYEYPDTINMLFVAEFIPFLKSAAFSYGIVAVLAICGVVFCLRAWSAAAWLLAIFAFGYSASVGLFCVISRYRVLVVPIFIIFAASGLNFAWDSWIKKDHVRLLKFAAISALGFVLVFFPVRHMRFAVPYNSLGVYFAHKGRLPQAELCYNKALQISPSFPDPYYNLFLLYRQAGEAEKALAFEERYEALKKIALATGK